MSETGKPTQASDDARLSKDEFCRRFVDHMCARAGFERFDDGTPVREYAAETAPTYWGDDGQRSDGPEECALSDISYWGDE